MASWGDLNARLNRLVREGVISGFRTNLADRPDLSQLAVVVIPGRDSLATHPEDLRRHIGAALAGIAPDAAITVEEHQAAPRARKPERARNSAETLEP
jgi:hypothetical protein